MQAFDFSGSYRNSGFSEKKKKKKKKSGFHSRDSFKIDLKVRGLK